MSKEKDYEDYVSGSIQRAKENFGKKGGTQFANLQQLQSQLKGVIKSPKSKKKPIKVEDIVEQLETIFEHPGAQDPYSYPRDTDKKTQKKPIKTGAEYSVKSLINFWEKLEALTPRLPKKKGKKSSRQRG